MAEFTPNYNLEKQNENEYIDVEKLNANFDTLDRVIAEAGNNPQLEADVTEIKTEMGNTADTGGSESGGSVFAKLNKIIHDVLGMIVNIGKTDDAGATETTGTVMGKLNRIVNSELNDGSVIESGERYYPQLIKKESELTSGTVYPSFAKTMFVYKNVVYVGEPTLKKVIAVDAKSLKVIGETALQTAMSNVIFVANNILYYSFASGSAPWKIVAFDAITLQKIAETTDTSFTTIYSIFVAGNRVYASDGGTKKVLVFDAITLEKIGESEVKAGYAQSMVVVGNTLYYADSSAKKIIAFDATTLEKKAETTVQSGFAQKIAANNDTVFYADWTSKKIIAFDATTLVKKSETTAFTGTADFFISLKDELLYCFIEKKYYILDAYTLTILKTISTSNSAWDIFATNAGVYALELGTVKAYIDSYDIGFYIKTEVIE